MTEGGIHSIGKDENVDYTQSNQRIVEKDGLSLSGLGIDLNGHKEGHCCNFKHYVDKNE